jgi:serine/threonine protein kinase
MSLEHNRVEDVFIEALDLRAAGERDAYLDRACGADVDLRARVVKLLDAHDKAAEAFLPMTGSSGAKAAEAIGTVIGPYKLLQVIGEGGFGTVYLAEQQHPVRRRVAVKIIKLGMDTKRVIARFDAERQALARMDHPNIARVLDAGATDTGRPFFVMELVRGVRITTYCDEHRLDTRQRLELFIQVCQAVQHAHQKGIIHRDIKPSNVLVTNHDGVPVPKVIDFGIAKATDGQMLTERTLFTAFDQFVGTPAYMSPEQAEWSELDVDTRSDIYSLGVLLYELLTGKTPFDQRELLQAGIDEMRRTLRERDPHRPSTKLNGLRADELTQTAIHRQVEPLKLKSLLSGDLDWIVMKALEKDRNRRYQTSNGMAMDVRRFLDDEAVHARPPSRLYRLRKTIRRNKMVFAAGLAAALALTAGLGIATWMFFRERAARELAHRALANEAMLRREAEAQSEISQAAILISQNRFLEASHLVESVALPVMKPSLEAAGVFRSLANWSVNEGRWELAAHHLLKLVHANRIDRTDMTDAATRELLKVGPALLWVGQSNQYQTFIDETLARFAHTTNAVAAEQLLKASTIAPLDPRTVVALEPLAKIVEESLSETAPQSKWEHYLFAWRAFALTRFAYRRGDYPNAIAWGNMCLDFPDQTVTRVVNTHALLALALQRAGQPDDARAELGTARHLLETKLPRSPEKGLPAGAEASGFWHDWIESLLLVNEAELEIEGAVSPRLISTKSP